MDENNEKIRSKAIELLEINRQQLLELQTLSHAFTKALNILDLTDVDLEKQSVWVLVPKILTKIKSNKGAFDFINDDILKILNKYKP
jgi:hypothetical protein